MMVAVILFYSENLISVISMQIPNDSFPQENVGKNEGNALEKPILS